MESNTPAEIHPNSRLRPRLIDLMLLVAAIAAASVAWRISYGSDIGTRASRGEGPAAWLVKWSLKTLLFVVPLLETSSWAVLLMYALSSRGSFQVRSRQPGYLTTLIATFISMPFLVHSAFFAYKRGGPIAVHLFCTSTGPIAVGWSVSAVWTTLWLTRSWHPAACWPDQLGRWIGAGWIAASILAYMMAYANLFG